MREGDAQQAVDRLKATGIELDAHSQLKEQDSTHAI